MSDNEISREHEHYYHAGGHLTHLALSYQQEWGMLQSVGFGRGLREFESVFSCIANGSDCVHPLAEKARDIAARWQEDIFQSPQHYGHRAAFLALMSERTYEDGRTLRLPKLVSETVWFLMKEMSICQESMGDICEALNAALNSKYYSEYLRCNKNPQDSFHLEDGRWVKHLRDVHNFRRIDWDGIFESKKAWFIEHTCAFLCDETTCKKDEVERIKDALGPAFQKFRRKVGITETLASTGANGPSDVKDLLVLTSEVMDPGADLCHIPLYQEVHELLECGYEIGTSGQGINGWWFILGVNLTWSPVDMNKVWILPKPLRGYDVSRVVVEDALKELELDSLQTYVGTDEWPQIVKDRLELEFDLSRKESAGSQNQDNGPSESRGRPQEYDHDMDGRIWSRWEESDYSKYIKFIREGLSDNMSRYIDDIAKQEGQTKYMVMKHLADRARKKK